MFDMKNNYTQFIIYEQNFGSKVHVDFRRICDVREMKFIAHQI